MSALGRKQTFMIKIHIQNQQLIAHFEEKRMSKLFLTSNFVQIDL
jgi:hypothetical protein